MSQIVDNKYFRCKACDAILPQKGIDMYCFCPACESANYISNNSAGDDNNLYFNNIYSDPKYNFIESRQKLFDKFCRLDSCLHFADFQKVNNLNAKIRSFILSGKTLEIGFGRGEEFVRNLKLGADIYGIDISEEAVRNFKLKYPAFAARVACASSFNSPVDVVYCNALLEHLDNPGEFLDNILRILKPNGRLCLHLPVMVRTPKHFEDSKNDINFWDPCHRILCSFKGLNTLFKKHGFTILESAPLEYYGYKVMNRIIRYGFNEIKRVRVPYNHFEKLSNITFTRILLESLLEKVYCADLALIASKKD